MEKPRFNCELFEVVATGTIEVRAVCDLAEKVLSIVTPPRFDGAAAYKWMSYSPNRDERRVSGIVLAKGATESVERVVHLGDEEAAEIGNMLDRECMRDAAGMTDATIRERCDGWCYREDWDLVFTAYSADGSAIAATEPLGYCSLYGDELGFEQVVGLLANRYGIFRYGNRLSEYRELERASWASGFYCQ